MNEMTGNLTSDNEVGTAAYTLKDSAGAEAAQALTGAPNEPRKWIEWARNSLKLFGPVMRKFASTLNDIVLSRRPSTLIIYGIYILRMAGLLVAVFGVFAPVIETGLEGVVGWFVNLLINVIIGIACFMIAEIALIIREISESLPARGINEPPANNGESQSEGY